MNIVSLIEAELANNPNIAIFHNIANAISHGINSKILAPGSALPPHRQLAKKLGVTVGTVSRAYAETNRRQLTTAIVGRGTYINSPSLTVDVFLEQEKKFDLGFIAPFEYLNPSLDMALKTLEEKNLSELLCYQEACGLYKHREIGASWAKRFGVLASANAVLISAGAQHALWVLLSSLFQAGDKIVAEPLTYPLLKQLCSKLCLNLIPTQVDQAGILPDYLNQLCKNGEIKGIYLMPSCQSPTLTQIPDYRRKELVEICRKHNVLIIEDDVYALSLEKRPNPIFNYAPERTFFIASTSEILSAGLRIAYICAPDAHIQTIMQGISHTISMAPPLMAEIAGIWIEDGTADQVMLKKREEAATRNVIARKILDGFSLETRSTGFFAWLKLPSPWTNQKFTDIMEQNGIKIAISDQFALPGIKPEPAIRFSLGSIEKNDDYINILETMSNILHGNI